MKKRNINSSIPPKEELKNFKVPEGYFEQNAIQLKDIAKSASVEESKVFRLKPVIGWLSTAAVITLIVFGVVNRKDTVSSTLSNDDLYELVDMGYVSFSSYELASELEFEDATWLDLDEEDAQDYLEDSDLYYLEETLLYSTY